MRKDTRWKISKHDVPTYNTWCRMKERCYNKNSKKYPSYGGRGITMCDRWKNSFNNFYDDMIEGYKPGLSIDRIDNNDGYYKENCRWATPKTQANNTRRNRRITFKGISKTLTDWSRELGVSHSFLQRRLSYGWTLQDVLTKPKRVY